LLSRETMTEAKQNDQPDPFLEIRDTPIYFQEDWQTGIGGGLWSTGHAMALYAKSDHAFRSIRELYKQHKKNAFDGLSLLELGSGNGFLSICFLALGQNMLVDLVVTDTREHLDLIRQTFRANSHISTSKTAKKSTRVRILEHVWGQFDTTDEETSLAITPASFDLIIGSDLAYRPDLHDPLIASLLHFSHSETVILLGVTMVDTGPEFFDKLIAAGFRYERLADALLEETYRGRTFGIFVISRSLE